MYSDVRGRPAPRRRWRQRARPQLRPTLAAARRSARLLRCALALAWRREARVVVGAVKTRWTLHLYRTTTRTRSSASGLRRLGRLASSCTVHVLGARLLKCAHRYCAYISSSLALSPLRYIKYSFLLCGETAPSDPVRRGAARYRFLYTGPHFYISIVTHAMCHAA